jgi:hypothetical protein
MRSKDSIIVGIVFIVLGLILVFLGLIQVTYYSWLGGGSNVRLAPISSVGILLFIAGCVFLALGLIEKEDRRIFSPPYRAYPPPTYQAPPQPYYQTAPPTHQPQQAPPPTASGIRYCVSCGRELRPESVYCPWCGTAAPQYLGGLDVF